MMTVLSWFFNEFSEDCRSYLLTSDFARDGNMMIENERMKDHVFIVADAL